MSDLIPFGILIKSHGLKGFISCRFYNKDSKILKKDFQIYFNDDVKTSVPNIKIDTVKINANRKIISITRKQYIKYYYIYSTFSINFDIIEYLCYI